MGRILEGRGHGPGRFPRSGIDLGDTEWDVSRRDMERGHVGHMDTLGGALGTWRGIGETKRDW